MTGEKVEMGFAEPVGDGGDDGGVVGGVGVVVRLPMIVSSEKTRLSALFHLTNLASRWRAEPGFAF